MEQLKRSAVAETPDTSTTKRRDSSTKSKKVGKQEMMLVFFANGRRLHRFEAELLGDHCVPSTIPELQKIHGIYFNREMVKVPNRFGSKTSVMKYWLSGKSPQKAQGILGMREAA
jgi:hypothetical protein